MIDRSQVNASVQLLMGVDWLLVIVIWPPKPVPQSLVTSKDAEAEIEVGGGMVSTIVPVPEVVARPAPSASDRFTWKVRLGLAVVSGRIGTVIVWESVPGLNVKVPDSAV